MAAFNEEQTEELKGLVGGLINSAITARDKMSDKKRAEDRAAIEASFAKTLTEQLAALKPAGGGEGGEGGEKGGKGGGKEGRNLEFDTLRKQHAEAMEAIKQANERVKRAEERRRDVERTNRIDATLSKAGVVDPFMRDLAIAHFDRKGRVVWSGDEDDATIVWNGDDGVPVGFEEGFGSWLKTDEAKRFLPAAGKGGSGGRPGNGKPPEEKKNVTLDDVGNWVLGAAGMPTR
jgi:hypothetical protein